MKLKKLVTIGIFLNLLFTQAVWGVIATEITQIANNIQLARSYIKQAQSVVRQAQQLRHQFNSYEEQIKQGKPLSQWDWGHAENHLNQLFSISRQSQDIANNLENLSHQFPDYSSFSAQNRSSEIAKKYHEMSDMNAKSIESTLKASNLQMKQFEDEKSTMDNLSRMGSTASGRLQAIQVGNQISAQQIEQMQKLRQLAVAQTRMQGAQIASEEKKEQYRNDFRKHYYGKTFEFKEGKRW